MRHGLSKTARHGLTETRSTAYRKPGCLASSCSVEKIRTPSNGANKESFGFLLTGVRARLAINGCTACPKGSGVAACLRRPS